VFTRVVIEQLPSRWLYYAKISAVFRSRFMRPWLKTILVMKAAELSAATFSNFACEFSSFRRRAVDEELWRSGTTFSPSTSTRGTACSGAVTSRRPAGPRRSGRAPGDYAAASVDGHVPHAADRFASTRSRPRDARAPREVCWNRFPCAEICLVRRLSPKRRMRKHPVVFLDIERDESPDCRDAAQ
jgi:hypothetical protein